MVGFELAIAAPLPVLLLLALLQGSGAPGPNPQAPGPQETATTVSDPKEKPFVFEPGADTRALWIPRQERLEYRAYLDLSIVSTHVGTVTQSCSVQEQKPSLLISPPSSGGETAAVKLRAEGSYAFYTLDSTIESRYFLQDWPRIQHCSTSEGSEHRRREVLIGKKDGVAISSYRRDTDKGAPPGTRIWRDAVLRKVPDGSLDMLGAVMAARTLIREHRESIAFPLLDKDRVWQLKLRRGEQRLLETKPGVVFDVVEVVLEPGPYPGESIGEDKLKQFEGVFGIHGSIHLWVEKRTGVAVRIQGDLPVGIITLGIDVVLDNYSGTPAAFAPVETEVK